MKKELSTARVNKLEYCTLALSGIESQHALACIFELFGVEIDKKNIFVDDYHVSRDQLQNLRECIVNQGSDFQEDACLFEEYLEMGNIDKDKFLQILDDLIQKSDPQNPKILISWSDDENKPVDLDCIKSIQAISEVVPGETLASVPADGLTIEEAFILFIETMYWGEGDRFYMVTEDEDGIKIQSSDCAFTETEADQTNINE